MTTQPYEHAAEKGLDRLIADLRELDRQEQKASLAAMRSLTLSVVGLDNLNGDPT